MVVEPVGAVGPAGPGGAGPVEPLEPGVYPVRVNVIKIYTFVKVFLIRGPEFPKMAHVVFEFSF